VRPLPRFGGGNFIPARRFFDRPMAMACSGERAPCSPSRICSISSRTNSPACVLGALPSRASSCARSIASSSGITKIVSPLLRRSDVEDCVGLAPTRRAQAAKSGCAHRASVRENDASHTAELDMGSEESCVKELDSYLNDHLADSVSALELI